MSSTPPDPNPPRQHLTTHALVRAWAEVTPEAVAITAPGRPPLTYRGLYRQVEETVDALNSMGLGREARIAVVLPNGPEAAVSFLAVAAGATFAPLNPAYAAPEFDRLLTGLGVHALVVPSGVDSPSVAVARRHGLPVIRLMAQSESEAGLFSLSGDARRRAVSGGLASEQDVALSLSTSGTTARPKIVPLTQANICHGARNVRMALDLSAADRCLNVMPLFHIHGLVGAVLSSVVTGGSVVCGPGYVASSFPAWLERFAPTWYTAVPTIHQAILARAAHDRAWLTGSRVRCIRSCSASLAPRVADELEELFQVPVVQAYGMTEAAHQVASNPLPPRLRKPGSVGLPVGMQVAIIDQAGETLRPGQRGEIAICGPSVTRGYEGVGGGQVGVAEWLRTGDEGCMDEDGYLFLTGRLKEMINRAGAKIAPAEVDEVLLGHPAVAQAVTFALPHATLGDDVAAAVVLRGHAEASEGELRDFVRRRLAAFKVPRRVYLVDEIPQGPTGKVQRTGLAQALGLVDPAAATAQAGLVAPRTAVEKRLAEIWREILRIDDIGVDTDFFELGGDSLLGTELYARVCDAWELQPSLTQFFQHPTIAGQAVAVAESQHGALSPSLVAIQPAGARPPFFCVTAGTEVMYLLGLGFLLAPDQPLYALRPSGLMAGPDQYDPRQAAAHYVSEIRSKQREGPYFIGGWCAGSVVALEVGRQLVAQGQRVGLLALFTPLPRPRRSLRSYGKRLSSLRLRVIMRRVLRTLRDVSLEKRVPAPPPPHGISAAVQKINRQAVTRGWAWKAYEGRITLFLTDDAGAGLPPEMHPRLMWTSLATHGADFFMVSGDHNSLVHEPHVRDLARQLRCRLDDAMATDPADGR